MKNIPTAEEFLNQKPFIHGMTNQEINAKIAALNIVLNQNLGNTQVVSYIIMQITDLKNQKR